MQPTQGEIRIVKHSTRSLKDPLCPRFLTHSMVLLIDSWPHTRPKSRVHSFMLSGARFPSRGHCCFQNNPGSCQTAARSHKDFVVIHCGAHIMLFSGLTPSQHKVDWLTMECPPWETHSVSLPLPVAWPRLATRFNHRSLALPSEVVWMVFLPRVLYLNTQLARCLPTCSVSRILDHPRGTLARSTSTPEWLRKYSTHAHPSS